MAWLFASHNTSARTALLAGNGSCRWGNGLGSRRHFGSEFPAPINGVGIRHSAPTALRESVEQHDDRHGIHRARQRGSVSDVHALTDLDASFRSGIFR